MDTKKLLVLLIILGVLVGATLLTRQHTEPGAAVVGKPVVSAFDLNAVHRVEIIRPGSTNAVRKTEGSWVVESLYNYPAHFEDIADHVSTLAEIEAGPLVHGGKDFPEDFGLADEATRVTLEDSEGHALATYIIGNRRENGSGHYMLAENGEVVLVDAGLGMLPEQGDDWVAKDLLDVKADQLTKIMVSGGTNQAVTVMVGDGSTYTVDDLGEDEEVNSSEAGRLSRALQYFRFNTVADPGTSDAEAGFTNAVTYTAMGKNGLTYTIQTGNKVENDRYARLDVTFKAPDAPTREQAQTEVPPKSEEESDEDWNSRVQETLDRLTAEYNESLEKAQEEMLRLGELKKWTFLVSSYSADSLRLGRQDVVQKVEPEEKAPEENLENQPIDSAETP